jgi:hypothetical protein
MMLISATFGFMIGEALGGHARLRKYLEQANADLREQVEETQPGTSQLLSALDQQRRVVNDIHKRISAVQKGLEKRAS